MSHPSAFPTRASVPGLVLPTLLVLALSAPRTAHAQTVRPTCESCHGEIEFLRQHVSTLEEAQALLAPASRIAASAHAGQTCTDCHSGFRRYPHGPSATTTACASCHEDQGSRWDEGMHGLDEAARCTDCHGTHDVRTAEALRDPDGIRVVRAACSSCHFDSATPAGDPHADSVSCAACHDSHATLPSEDEHARTHVLNQGATCGACHQDAWSAWNQDAHGSATPHMALPGGLPPEGASQAEPPTCAGCHGAHGILARSDASFEGAIVDRCAHCHEHYAESFADSYHGQASELGSEAVATCQDCHGSHGVHGADDPRSMVSEGRLLETCQTCHPRATAGFALFQPHADHSDRERYPYVYWSYHLMTALLIGVFTVFGAHTVLWLLRLTFDALRGTPHGARHDAGD